MTAWSLLAATMAVAASALAMPAAQGSQTYSGRADYQVYCSSCHGTEARGDGSIAKSLTKRPSDLTQLTKRHDGVFPSDAVFKIIDGRSGAGHDNADMPRWGEVFSKSSESASPAQTSERIDTLVKYLETLQAK